jgi:class 3 adenylate cyclase/tetratricopeptide (TPR) repeat protein
MICAKCQHENRPHAKFCEECAAPLPLTCGNCGSEVFSTAKFCPECGHPMRSGDPRFASPRTYTPQNLADKILTTRATVEGERKQVTVLFADVKGSMELFAERDAEDVQKLLDPVIGHMIEAVHRYEGTVNKVMGDGIMALFGAPLSHEDHAVRACYAALRMQESVMRYGDEIQRSEGLPITIRIGLNSGEIVVRGIGNDLNMDYTVIGQTAHMAARMEQMAKPGSVLTTALTVKLAEGYVAAKSLGLVQVKGVVDPVPVYEVTGAGSARTRLQVAAARGLTRFVGRDSETERLRRAQQLAQQGRGQVAALVGEAGVGKSRLVQEFIHSKQTAGSLVLQSNSSSYEHAMLYRPIVEILADYFKIDARDSTKSIRQKVTGKMSTLDFSLQDTIPPLLDLFEALEDQHPFRSLDPREHQRHTSQAVIRLLVTESRIQPVIAVIEDLNWKDVLSVDLLNDLVNMAQNARFFLIVSYRPPYKDQWSNRPNYHQLRIDPLVDESLAEFLNSLIGTDSGLSALKSFLVERANGNPFFVEEMVRTLVDAGALSGTRGNYRVARPFSDIEVPPTVQAVLAARLDALPPAEKRVVQEAAVIGHHVSFTLLHAISGLPETEIRGLLDSLQAGEFLYPTQLFPDLQYTFKHNLTHDVAYNGVLRERRREVHGRVLAAIETIYADRLGEHVERLANHAVRGELREKAVQYLRQAGAKAAMRSALSDARTRFEEALGILNNLPENDSSMEQAFEIRLELRPVLRKLGEGRLMLQHLEQAERLAERMNDDSRLGRVCAFMTTTLSTLDETDEALRTGNRAVEIARRLGDLRLQILATTLLEQAHYYRGDYQRVVELAFDNISTLPPDWVHEYFGMTVPSSVVDRAWLTMSLAELGRFAEAAKYGAQAIQLAEPTQHAFTIGWARFAASLLHLAKGEWAKALSVAEQWITMLRKENVGIHLPWAVAGSAWALAHMGEPDEALNRIRETEHLLEHHASTGIVGHRGWSYHAIGRSNLILGRLDEAQRLSLRALEACQRQAGFKAHALRLLGDVASQPDGFDAQSCETYYREALALAEQRGMRSLAAHCHFGLGKLYRRSGQEEKAGVHVDTAMATYRDLDMRFGFEHEPDVTSAGSGAVRVH